MKLPRSFWIFSLLLLAVTLFYLNGALQVPFHPDESTQLFMSQDFFTFFSDPLRMAWDSGQEIDLRQHYRLLDAPLTRYLLGLGLAFSRQSPLLTDWDWGKTWDQNKVAGALPSTDQLLAGRRINSLLIPLGLICVYWIGKSICGWPTGLLAAALLGSNALVLLHNRRAMAESILTLTVSLVMLGLVKFRKHPALLGLLIGLAVNAKQSTIGLALVGLLAILQSSWTAKKNRLCRSLFNIAIYGGVILIVTLALNPFLWRSPLHAARVAWQERQELTARQLALQKELAPQQMLNSTTQKTFALLANLYILPPSFKEIGNYQEQTAASEAQYLSSPANQLLRGLLGGGILLSLTLFGLIVAFFQIRPNQPGSDALFHQRWSVFYLLLATLAQATAILLAFSFAWQRYVIPLVPFVCLWIAYGITVPALRQAQPPVGSAYDQVG